MKAMEETQTNIGFKIILLFFISVIEISCSKNNEIVDMKISDAHLYNYEDAKFHHSGHPVMDFNIEIRGDKKDIFVINNSEIYLVKNNDSIKLHNYSRSSNDTLVFNKKKYRKIKLQTKIFELDNFIDTNDIRNSLVNFLDSSYLSIHLNNDAYIIKNTYAVHFVDVNNPPIVIRSKGEVVN